MEKAHIRICSPENLGGFNSCFIGGCTVYLQFGVVVRFLLGFFGCFF